MGLLLIAPNISLGVLAMKQYDEKKRFILAGGKDRENFLARFWFDWRGFLVFWCI